MKTICTYAITTAALLQLSACTVGPDYSKPTNENLDLPISYGQFGDPAFVSGKSDLRNWWTVFNDPTLEELIEKARVENRDLRVAVSRVQQARLRVDLAQASRSPQVSVAAGATTNEDGQISSNIGLQASWDLDIFGKVARQIESEDAAYQATEEDRRDIQVSLFAQVAQSYLSVRSLQAQLHAAQQNIESQKEILKLTEVRFDNGISSGLDVSQAKQVLASSQASVPALRIALAQNINTIAVLVGTHPQGLHVDLREPKPIPVPPSTITVGLPAQLLRQRPDIRSAERNIAAQSAKVGVATADLYPSFTLNGNLGFASTDGNLFDAANRSFALGPSLQWSIFDGNRVRNQIKFEEFGLEQAVLIYEGTVLKALEETESAMTAFIEQRIEADATNRSAQAARTTMQLGTQAYKDGLVGFQDVLSAQQKLFSEDIREAKSRGLASQNLVSLYKALGGGWNPDQSETID